MGLDNQTQGAVDAPVASDMMPASLSPDNLHHKDFMSAPAAASMPSEMQPSNSADSQLPNVIFLKGQPDANTAAVQHQIDKTSSDLVNYIDGAKHSLDIAIYHFDLTGSDPTKPLDKSTPMGKVVAALNEKAEEGVKIRLAVYQPDESNSLTATTGPFKGLQLRENVDGKATDFSTNIFDKNITVEGIKGSKLMHDKFMVRDSGSNNAGVWTGSTNFTDEAFGLQDNNIIQVQSNAIANDYEQDFNQMWKNKSFAKTGGLAGSGTDISQAAQVGDSEVSVGFSPASGQSIDTEIANQINGAKHSVDIASMDLSSEQVLNALAEKLKPGSGVTVEGIYDGAQMRGVEDDWTKNNDTAKLELWDQVKQHLVAKPTNAFGDGPANFMHNKIVDVDNNTVVTGSFNFSESAEKNAENILEIKNPQIGSKYADYIDDLVQTYGNDKNQ